MKNSKFDPTGFIWVSLILALVIGMFCWGSNDHISSSSGTDNNKPHISAEAGVGGRHPGNIDLDHLEVREINQ